MEYEGLGETLALGGLFYNFIRNERIFKSKTCS